MQRGLQVGDVAVGHRDQRLAGGYAGRAERLLPVGLADDHLQAEPAGHRHPGRVLALVHADHVDAKVVQLADDPGADVAQAGDDDVVGQRPVLRRSDPVSRAPTIAAVTSGRKASPSKVSRNWATFSAVG